jgi:membrane protein DedA with SNARE-associated domain
MPLLPFTLASAVGRGGRFFLVAGLIYFGGEPLERNLKRYVDTLGWAVVVLVVIAVLLLNL